VVSAVAAASSPKQTKKVAIILLGLLFGYQQGVYAQSEHIGKRIID
jgi:hypothetical protein